jgi:16S rRNA (uracil1498-N3)-methyltransferase
MSRRRFYVPRDSIRNGAALLPPDQAHHLRKVLRMAPGDIVEIFDGEGNGYIGAVEIHGVEVSVRLLNSIPAPESPAVLVLASALIKSTKFEWMLQKTTELGVDEIIPIQTRLSEIQIPDNKVDARMERWSRIVHEASKQCGRFTAPRVRRPLSFKDLIGMNELAAYAKFLFYEKAHDYWRFAPDSLSNRVVLCFGPEGGWDGDEVEQASKAGYSICSLGPLVLRAETAAIAATAIIQYHLQITNDELRMTN